jgi:hypothetical protein
MCCELLNPISFNSKWEEEPRMGKADEQAAYDECGLTDEMNAALGYSGQFVAETPKEET